MAGRTERVSVTVRWTGGVVSVHHVNKSVFSYEQLHDFQRLSARIRELKDAGQQSGEIAAQLNAEGYRAARGDGRFTADRVRQVVSRLGLGRPKPATPGQEARLRSGEVWMTELACELKIPIPTLTAWCRKGWVHARKVMTPDPRWAVKIDAGRAGQASSPARGPRLGDGAPIPGAPDDAVPLSQGPQATRPG